NPDSSLNIDQAFVLSAGYDGERGVAYLRLYDPETRQIRFWFDNTGHKPYCLSDLSPEELYEINALKNHHGLDHIEQVVKYDPLLARDMKLSKIVAKDPLSIGGRASGCIRDIIPKAWEADIRYYDCFIYDRQIIPGMPYCIKNGVLKPCVQEVSQDVHVEVKRIFASETAEFAEYIDHWFRLLQCPIPAIRRTSIDIEVAAAVENHVPDPSEASDPIIAVAMYDSDGVKRVFLLKRESFEEDAEKSSLDAYVQYFKDERELLKEVYQLLLEYPVVLTFNGDDFDIRYLYNRGVRLGYPKDAIPIILSSQSAALKYGVHIDLYKFFFNRSIQLYAFGAKYTEMTLNGVSEALLGEGKEELGGEVAKMTDQELAAYCLKDARLTLQLTMFDDELVMKLIVLLMRITKLPMEDLTRQGVSSWIRNMMYFEHRRMNYLIPRPQDILEIKGKVASKAVIKGKKYKGAIVVNPLPGVHFNVEVLDFASLYPSIIKVHNLSYETVLCPHFECRENKIAGLPHWVVKLRRGMSSLIIGSLRDIRVKWFKRKAKDRTLNQSTRSLYNVVQLTLKVLLNASYGVMGSESFDLYCPPLAEAVTAIGRNAIEKTVEKARRSGIRVVYGDTDSIFLEAPTEAQVEELIRWSDKELSLELEVDKKYRYAVFSNLKKNYLGVYPDGVADVKGLMGKKRHMPAFLKKAFMEMMDVLGKVQTPDDFEKARLEIKRIVRDCYLKLRRREYPLEDLAFNVMISRPPEKYTKTTPQHVKAAYLLTKAGREVRPGDIISFVKTSDELGVRPLELASVNMIDVAKYVEYVESTFEQLFDALGVAFDEVVGIVRLDSFWR
ncbi:MAG: DNA-directed DNA polymerase I, partial [Candidatus Bathyarchaeia archaeon]